MTNTYLQLFLLFDVFFMGVIAATAIRHAYAHFRPQDHEPQKAKTPSLPASQTGHLPPAVREHLLQTAETNFQAVLARAASELQKDLESTAVELKKQLDKLGTETIGKELEHYRTRLAELQKQTEDQIGGGQQELANYQAELKAKMAEQINTEKQTLIAQIDTKLGDAVHSFLLETLQHNVDLGAQSAYLTSMLNEHKTELAKGIKDEV